MIGQSILTSEAFEQLLGSRALLAPLGLATDSVGLATGND